METYIGMIAPFAFDFAPPGWIRCDGTTLNINQYQALFVLVGTTYGGNGLTTFQLPNLCGRVPVGMGQGPGLSDVILGEEYGAEQVTLAIHNLPAHDHSVHACSSGANRGSPANNNLAVPVSADGSPITGFSNAAPDTTLGTPTSAVGSNEAFSIRPPSLGLNWCICAQGIFPSRN